MPQLLLIKDANTPSKKVGDIVGVYDDSHRFSQTEQDYFYIEYVAGFRTALELKQALHNYEIKSAFRLTRANEWTFEEPEEKKFWRRLPNGRWCEYNVRTKYKTNYYALTIEERNQLAREDISREDRLILLAKCENRIENYSENLVENEDLNAISAIE